MSANISSTVPTVLGVRTPPPLSYPPVTIPDVFTPSPEVLPFTHRAATPRVGEKSLLLTRVFTHVFIHPFLPGQRRSLSLVVDPDVAVRGNESFVGSGEESS